MSIINEFNASHYKWGEDCDGWYLLETAGLAIIKEKMPPDTAERLHYHEKAQQFFYILSGAAQFEIEGEYVTLHVHEGISIEPGIKHKIMNTGNTGLEFIVVSQPESHGDRINLE